MVNRDVNNSVVKAMAKTAIRFRRRLARRKRKLSLRMHFWFETFITATSSAACDDAAIFNADDPVSQLGDFLIVGDHHDGLGEFLTGHLQQT